MTTQTCIFCRIIKGEIRGDIVDRDELVLALRDIHPQAPVHVLIMPVEHIPYVKDVGGARGELLGRMAAMAIKVAQREGIAESGYRLAINHGPDSQNNVAHLHMHLMGGRRLDGKMG